MSISRAPLSFFPVSLFPPGKQTLVMTARIGVQLDTQFDSGRGRRQARRVCRRRNARPAGEANNLLPVEICEDRGGADLRAKRQQPHS